MSSMIVPVASAAAAVRRKRRVRARKNHASAPNTMRMPTNDRPTRIRTPVSLTTPLLRGGVLRREVRLGEIEDPRRARAEVERREQLVDDLPRDAMELGAGGAVRG